ncbi:unnamed protein product [Rangifer tarandus platyrhynchus]|uniref:Uncharacterized protein n=2 Tax=Rangifer tarandus platyrhynchus TaxID=3082113 RepID=A0ACB0EMH1_RANTA|nr:unnamed protein product [Rangifer tarandus platyrhynchus]CAI9701689.1 unnamed protein product [Rangifer tarandus platyrhynchus]
MCVRTRGRGELQSLQAPAPPKVLIPLVCGELPAKLCARAKRCIMPWRLQGCSLSRLLAGATPTARVNTRLLSKQCCPVLVNGAVLRLPDLSWFSQKEVSQDL